MAKRTDLNKVMVIGSGPIIIGQAAEFDYAGTQACKSLKEEGLEVILVNSNPATIMTDVQMADRIYIEPLNVESITKIIEKEKPQGLIPGLGGQTGLNLAVELWEAGVLEKYGVELLGTKVEAIKRAEDREGFKSLMMEIGEPIPESAIITSIEEGMDFAHRIGLPLIVRPAYTLGGSGGGIATTEEELLELLKLGLKNSRIGQVLVEQSVAGWKEIEFEVMRDTNDNCIAICSMENFDPMGIHTGDSIVVAPTQTLTNGEYQMLRSASLKIIRALQVEGGCNVQLALNPNKLEYVIIEVNPRVSRSSALASKATGYPIAKVAAKIAIGYTLDEIINPVTGKTTACFEPTIDYVVVKIPRWPFDKFATANRRLGTQMKATGEVMAIERNFEAALLKAVRSLELGIKGFTLKNAGAWTEIDIENKMCQADDERLFVIAEALRRHWTLKEIHQYTKIDYWFLTKLQNIIRMESILKTNPINKELLHKAKKLGFSDSHINVLNGMKEIELSKLRKQWGIKPVYKMVDTCAAEFESSTPYYYSTYEQENEVIVSNRKKVIVLGSGPIRIGQGIEFDYCSVHSVMALQDQGIESIIINNNPETVSTDFDTSDKLYFEPLTIEDVMNIVDLESPYGVVVQFGGQTAINLAGGLAELGVKILGTSIDGIDLAEDRKRFEKLLRDLNIPQTKGVTVTSSNQALVQAEEIGFPLVVRPSYVLGGRAMEVVYNLEELKTYAEWAVGVSGQHPILLDRYLRGKEVEVDAICDGDEVLIPGIMEHIERAGVHSGDSMAVYPPQTLTEEEKKTIIDYTTKLGKALGIIGLYNIQFVIYQGQIYVLEVNPRASRTVPILSKVTGIPMLKVATKLMLGQKLTQQGYKNGLWPEPPYITIKAPVFSFEKLLLVDTSLGPEMKSTGEVMGIDYSFGAVLAKTLQASLGKVPQGGNLLVSIADRDKEEALPIIKKFVESGFNLLATEDTAKFLASKSIMTEIIEVNMLLDMVKANTIQLVLNTPTKGKLPDRTGFKLRRTAVEFKIPCFTSLDTAKAYVDSLEKVEIIPRALQDLFEKKKEKKMVV